MDQANPILNEGSLWDVPEGEEIHHVETRSESPTSGGGQRRLSSAASSSTRSTSDSTDTATRGRRMRPSITSSKSQLPTVQESHEQRMLSVDSAKSNGTSPGSSHTKVGSEEGVVSSKKVLTSFSKVVTRNLEKESTRKRLVEQYSEEDHYQRQTLDRLIGWADAERQSLTSYLLSKFFPKYRSTLPPSTDELVALAKHYYPPRARILCHVCDFGLGRAEHKTVELGQLEDYWVVKPDWVDLRWIHAPRLGLGLTHSSVEDIFLHEGEQGREFTHAGRAGWPYLETEVLNLRARQNFQEMRDVWALLHNRHDLKPQLDASSWEADTNASLVHDIGWRASHLATPATFWNLSASDMPWQLTEGIAMGAQGPFDGLRPISRNVEKQTLSMHPFYSKAQLVRNPFRTFHRGDGFLLTLSSMNGINYLDKDLNSHLSESPDVLFGNDDASAVGHAFQAFAENGTSTWWRRNVEWFLVYLLTEVGTTPHSIRQGFNAPSIETAYSSVIQDLKRRRHEKWEPNKTVDLVRDYLNCIDEVTTIRLITHKKLDLFTVLLQDVNKFEAEDLRMGLQPDNPDGESASERLTWAIGLVKAQAECFDRLLIDLRQSMDALFQLRSIEQNELAIVSDAQNKAILVFTGVTIVFLPLSFFTSYYGMNLHGIVDTDKGQGYFWKICGSIGFAIVVLVTLGAFRHRLKRLFHVRVRKSPRSMV